MYAIHRTAAQGAQVLKLAQKIVPTFQFSPPQCKPNIQLVKTIYPDWQDKPYDRAKQFLFTYKQIEYLEDFAKALEWLGDQPNRCIIRGRLKSGLSGWQRRLLNGDRYDRATIECGDRSWIVLDLDGVAVPHEWGQPDKVAEAAYYIRDNLLPSYFRGVRCVASATSKTGKYPDKARLRLFFLTAEAASNEALCGWAEGLARGYPGLNIDPSVMQAHQIIYTRRPHFSGMAEPVPKWGRVRLLDGADDYLKLDVPRVTTTKHRKRPKLPQPVCGDIPEEMLDMLDKTAGEGVCPIDTSDKAWAAIRRVFERLDKCPKGHGGRHVNLRNSAYELVCLATEGELSWDTARDAYFAAAENIWNGDKKYDDKAIQQRWDGAVSKVGE
jgi:hypothetical protein